MLQFLKDRRSYIFKKKLKKHNLETHLKIYNLQNHIHQNSEHDQIIKKLN